jgi:hypothetical protein
MPSPTRYAVTIDTEEEWDWGSGYPTGPASVRNIAHLTAFQDRVEWFGAAVTYFTNHAVLTDPASRDIICRLSQRPNVEIGLHIHPWNTPPVAPTDRVTPRESFLHNLPGAEAEKKLDESFRAFEKAGIVPTCFRGGRYSTSPLIQSYLRDRGVIADCSVLPFNTWADEGAPDYRDRDLTPRRLPPRNEDDLAMWELPLTFGFVGKSFDFWRRAFRLFDSPGFNKLPFGGVAGRLFGARKCWLNFENPLGEGMTDLFDVVRSLDLPYACFTMHSSSLLPGGSPYAKTQADVGALLKRVDDTLETLNRRSDFLWSTVTETAHHLEATHAGHRHQPVG